MFTLDKLVKTLNNGIFVEGILGSTQPNAMKRRQSLNRRYNAEHKVNKVKLNSLTVQLSDFELLNGWDNPCCLYHLDLLVA